MPLEVPGGHELGHHRLGTDLGMAHVHRPALGEGLDQGLRQHQVAQAQGRKGDLAEGPDVDHPALAVQRRQGGQGRTAVAVLAVVVVLDDPALAAFGPGQQLQAPGQAHDHPGGVLVGRRDIGQAAAVQLLQLAAVDALLVHRHALQLRTRQGEGMPRGAVAGVFHSHLVAGLHQQLCTKADALLRATGDHNLFSRAVQAPSAAQVGGDQAAQPRIARRVAVAQLPEVGPAPESRIQLGPDLEREQIEGWHTNRKARGGPLGGVLK